MPRYKLVRDQTIHLEFDKHHFFFFSPKIRPTKTHNSTSHIYPDTEVPTATHVTRDQRISGHCKIITVYNLLTGSWYTVSTRICTTLHMVWTALVFPFRLLKYKAKHNIIKRTALSPYYPTCAGVLCVHPQSSPPRHIHKGKVVH